MHIADIGILNPEGFRKVIRCRETPYFFIELNKIMRYECDVIQLKEYDG